MCLSVPVYRRITLCKHCAFALNRQHKILTANVFLIRGYSGQSHTVWESDWESNRPFIYHGRAPLCPCACACSYYNGSKLCMTLARFLPFKSCFWEGTAAVRSQTATCAAAAGSGSDRTRHGLVQNIQGTVTLAKNILVNSAISVWKVRKKNLLRSMCGILPFLLYFSLTLHAQRIFFKVHTDPDLRPSSVFKQLNLPVLIKGPTVEADLQEAHCVRM